MDGGVERTYRVNLRQEGYMEKKPTAYNGTIAGVR